MRVAVTIISICLTLLIAGSGCSKKEEQPPPAPKQKVVKSIKMPSPEKAETPLPSKQIGVKSSGKGEEASKTLVTIAKEKEIAIKKETGYYIVKRGDTLSRIAGRNDVYGDPLKWPILYRYNLDKLDDMKLGENFPEREISEGVRMKVLTPDEVKENLKKRAHNIWVVNILSAPTKAKIVPQAIRLIRSGYPVYITRAKVKGKDWMRLRLGFFKNRKQADAKGKKIMTMLNLSDFWSTKVGAEFEEFGGY